MVLLKDKTEQRLIKYSKTYKVLSDSCRLIEANKILSDLRRIKSKEFYISAMQILCPNGSYIRDCSCYDSNCRFYRNNCCNCHFSIYSKPSCAGVYIWLLLPHGVEIGRRYRPNEVRPNIPRPRLIECENCGCECNDCECEELNGCEHCGCPQNNPYCGLCECECECSCSDRRCSNCGCDNR